jgi:hypothetical protein
MYRSSVFLAAVIVGGAWGQQVAAKSAVEVGQIAKAITIEIQAVGSSHIGSGSLLQQLGPIANYNRAAVLNPKLIVYGLLQFWPTKPTKKGR